MSPVREAFAQTLRAVFADRFAVVTLIGAVVLYSFFYPVAYRHQVAAGYPVVVVDLDNTAASRALLRQVDAVRAVRIVETVPAMAQARTRIEQGHAEGVVAVPAGFERALRRGEQGELVLLGNGAFLGRAGTVLEGLGDAVTAYARQAALGQARQSGAPAAPPLRLVQRPLFNTREGYGSAIVPGVAQLIVQQTLLIGMLVMAGTRRERLGRLAFSRAGLLGIGLAFALIGSVSMLYYNGLVLWLQDYPRGGNPLGVLLGGSVYVAAVVAFALFMGSFFRTRERPFQLLTVTSLPLFFLSGLSWPHTAMPEPLVWLARLLPSTSGIEAMVQFNQMGARVAEAARPLWTLAGLVVLYGSLAVWRYAPGRGRGRAACGGQDA